MLFSLNKGVIIQLPLLAKMSYRVFPQMASELVSRLQKKALAIRPGVIVICIYDPIVRLPPPLSLIEGFWPDRIGGLAIKRSPFKCLTKMDGLFFRISGNFIGRENFQRSGPNLIRPNVCSAGCVSRSHVWWMQGRIKPHLLRGKRRIWRRFSLWNGNLSASSFLVRICLKTARNGWLDMSRLGQRIARVVSKSMQSASAGEAEGQGAWQEAGGPKSNGTDCSRCSSCKVLCKWIRVSTFPFLSLLHAELTTGRVCVLRKWGMGCKIGQPTVEPSRWINIGRKGLRPA